MASSNAKHSSQSPSSRPKKAATSMTDPTFNAPSATTEKASVTTKAASATTRTSSTTKKLSSVTTKTSSSKIVTSFSITEPTPGPRAPAAKSGGKAMSYSAALSSGLKSSRDPVASNTEDTERVFPPLSNSQQLREGLRDPAHNGANVPAPKPVEHAPVIKASPPEAPASTTRPRGHPPKDRKAQLSHAVPTTHYQPAPDRGSGNQDGEMQQAGPSPAEVPSETQDAPPGEAVNRKKKRISLEGSAPAHYAHICDQLPAELRSIVENWCGDLTAAVKVINAFIACLPPHGSPVTRQLIVDSELAWETPKIVDVNTAALSEELSVLCGTKHPNGAETGLICTVIRPTPKTKSTGKKSAGKKSADSKTLVCKASDCPDARFETAHNPNENFANHFIYEHAKLEKMFRSYISGHECSFKREADLRNFLYKLNQGMGQKVSDGNQAVLRAQWRKASAERRSALHTQDALEDGMDLSSSIPNLQPPQYGYHEDASTAAAQPDLVAMPPQDPSRQRQTNPFSPEPLVGPPRFNPAYSGVAPYMRQPPSVVVGPGIQVSMSAYSQYGQRNAHQPVANQYTSFGGRTQHARPGPSSSSYAAGENAYPTPFAPQPPQWYPSDEHTGTRVTDPSASEYMDLSASFPPPQAATSASEPHLTPDQLEELNSVINDHTSQVSSFDSRALSPLRSSSSLSGHAWGSPVYSPAAAGHPGYPTTHPMATGASPTFFPRADDPPTSFYPEGWANYVQQPPLLVYFEPSSTNPPFDQMSNAPTSQNRPNGHPMGHNGYTQHTSSQHNSRSPEQGRNWPQ